MKATADEAVAESPSSREGRRVPPVPGRRVAPWVRSTSRGTTCSPISPIGSSLQQLDPETPFMIAYTSGTTGKPKGSVHVHGGFLVKIAQEVRYQLDARPGEVLYWVTDMGWIMGPLEMVGGHANGAAVFMYEGAPNYPGPRSSVGDVRASRGHDPRHLADPRPRV